MTRATSTDNAAPAAERYPHLSPELAHLADLSKDERIAFVWRDRFLEFTQTSSVLKAMNRLYEQEDALRPRGMLLVGESLIGKTFVINEFKKQHPADDNLDGDAAIVPIVHVQIPDRARNDLYREILLALKGKIASTAKPDAVRTACIELMRSVGMRVLIIEEIQHLLVGTSTECEAALNKLKYIMSQLNRPIIATGVETASGLINKDTQIRSRFRERRLRALMADEDEFIESLILWEAMLPLQKPSRLDDPAIAQAIFNKTNGVTGQIAQLLQHSAELAIESGDEYISLQTLEDAEEEMGELAGASAATES